MNTIIDTSILKEVYNDFITLGVQKLTELQQKTQMEDEFLSSAASTIIAQAMSNSIQAVQTFKNLELVDAQVAAENAQTDKLQYELSDILPAQKNVYIKQLEELTNKIALIDEQVLAEKIQNGGLYYVYTYNEDGSINTKTLQNGATKSTYELDKELKVAQRLLAERQTTGFDDKQYVEAAQHAGGVVGMIYASGADVPTDAWTWAKTKVELITNRNYTVPTAP